MTKRCAHGDRSVGIGEFDAVCGELVEMRCVALYAAAVAGDAVAIDVVSEDKNEVSRVRRNRTDRREKERGGESEDFHGILSRGLAAFASEDAALREFDRFFELSAVVVVDGDIDFGHPGSVFAF